MQNFGMAKSLARMSYLLCQHQGFLTYQEILDMICLPLAGFLYADSRSRQYRALSPPIQIPNLGDSCVKSLLRALSPSRSSPSPASEVLLDLSPSVTPAKLAPPGLYKQDLASLSLSSPPPQQSSFRPEIQEPQTCSAFYYFHTVSTITLIHCSEPRLQQLTDNNTAPLLSVLLTDPNEAALHHGKNPGLLASLYGRSFLR